MHATQSAAGRFVRGKRALQFGEYCIIIACLQARIRAHRIAVHGVAHPCDGASGGLHGLHQWRQRLGDAARTQTRDDRDAARPISRFEGRDQLHQISWGHARPGLDPDGVFQPAKVLHMRPIQLAGPVANPQKMRAKIIPTLAHRLG